MWPFKSKKEVEEESDEEQQDLMSGCPHLRVVYKCTAVEGDTRPVFCSAQSCPARMQDEIVAEFRKTLHLKDYV